MSIPINQQKKIKKYFNLLVQEFIKDPLHNKNINIIFKQKFKNPLKRGSCEQSGGRIEWQEEANGAKVPGSEKKFPYYYKVSFLDKYENEEDLRGTVVHEFTHLYIYATVGGKHEHDDRFYSTMEQLESWLNQNQGLSPRKDKSHDYDQYVGNNKKYKEPKTWNGKENICPECFSSSQHSSQCPYNQHHINDPQKAEFDTLKNLLKNSKDLADLEKNYQTIQSNPLYSKTDNKNNTDNKNILDILYQTQKWHLQSQNDNNQTVSTNNSNSSSNENGSGADRVFWLCLAGGGIILVGIIGYLIGRKPNYKLNQKKKNSYLYYSQKLSFHFLLFFELLDNYELLKNNK